jgi:hypothetical protein
MCLPTQAVFKALHNSQLRLVTALQMLHMLPQQCGRRWLLAHIRTVSNVDGTLEMLLWLTNQSINGHVDCYQQSINLLSVEDLHQSRPVTIASTMGTDTTGARRNRAHVSCQTCLTMYRSCLERCQSRHPRLLRLAHENGSQSCA